MRPFPSPSPLFPVFWFSCLLIAFSGAQDAKYSREIDRLVEAGHREHQINPNPPTSDETFLRRAYLDLIGRIPTAAEAKAFLDTEESNKRSLLVKNLVNSEGYVSHFFNFWADILRVRDDADNNSGQAYAAWVKQALRENKPYDQFVRELITASGPVWENGAVGFYMRDANMPLDHLAYMSQVFIGTQIVCAQCHNHPFDKWTQKDFYEMAAYTYGVDTRARPDEVLGLEKTTKKLDRGNRKKNRELKRALDKVLEPLGYGVQDEAKRVLRLPHDYQYSDARPRDEVRAHPLFGKNIQKGRKVRENFANWMASRDNPRFTTVIANRLWKKVMGRGLIEPVDQLKDDTLPSNPNLMNHLVRVMKEVNFDQRRFLRILMATRTYQRESTVEEVGLEKPYHFAGPLLKRMTAEQIWDSLLTAIIPEVDTRPGKNNYAEKRDELLTQAETLRQMSSKEILDLAREVADVESVYDDTAKRLRSQIAKEREEGNRAESRRLSKQLREAERTRDRSIRDILPNAGGSMMMMSEKKETKKKEDKDSPWRGFDSNLVRASELRSPAPRGHFIREFGQSDRESIEAADVEPTVGQALALMNGKTVKRLTDKKSTLAKGFYAAPDEQAKQDHLFLTLLTRYPQAQERDLMKQEMEGKPEEEGFEDLIWALVNTREFSFIQ